MRIPGVGLPQGFDPAVVTAVYFDSDGETLFNRILKCDDVAANLSPKKEMPLPVF
ncbi:MAG: hypothetical protein PVJ53_05840 [Desulfobacterales bacterium]